MPSAGDLVTVTGSILFGSGHSLYDVPYEAVFNRDNEHVMSFSFELHDDLKRDRTDLDKLGGELQDLLFWDLRRQCNLGLIKRKEKYVLEHGQNN